jgi:hypothetical protein
LLNVTASWNQSATWNTSNGATAWTAGGNFNPSAADIESVGATSGYYSWNATALAQDWQLANNGLLLKATGNAAGKAFASTRSADGFVPLLFISFTGASSAPYYSAVSSNVTTVVAGDAVSQWANWTDFAGNLSGFIFSDNYSGAWTNYSWQPFTGNSNVSNYTAKSNYTPGAYGWLIWANNTFDQFNATPIQVVNDVANTPPSVVQANVSPQYPIGNSTLGCSFIITNPNSGQAIGANVTWWENGVHIPSYDSNNTCTNDTVCVASANVSSGAILPPQQWTCEINAFNDHGGVNQSNASVFVNYLETFFPDQDTYVENDSNFSHGTDTLLKVGTDEGLAYDNWTLLHFNVSSLLSGVFVVNATLGVFLNLGFSDPNNANLSINTLNASWNQSATWYTSDGIDAWSINTSYNTTPESSQIVSSASSYNFSATHMTSLWAAGSNNGTLLMENTPISYDKAFNSELAGTGEPFLYVQYLEYPPIIANATMLPANPIQTENLNCSFWVIDNQSTLVKANVTWWQNGNPVHTFDSNAIQCANSTLCYSPTLVNYTNTSVGDSWTCQVTVYDQSGGWAQQNATVTINHLAVLVMPSNPVYADEGDMVIFNATPNVVNTTHPLLIINSTSNAALARSILSFHVSGSVPINSTITNATLVLTSAGGVASNVSIYAINDSQIPWQADWVNRTSSLYWQAPGGDYNGIPLDTQNVPTTNGTVSFNATEAALNWTNSSLNYGLLLRFANETSGQNATFYSGQNANVSLRPTLIIRFTQVPDFTPLLFNVSVNPATAYANSTLNCSFIAVSSTMPALNANISWYLNGSLQPALAANNVNCANSTLCSSPVTLNQSELARSQTWSCQVTVSDSFGLNNQTNSSNVTILDSPPSPPTFISPSSGTYDLSVPMYCGGATDIDNDVLNYSIESNYTGSWVLVTSGLSSGENYTWNTQGIPDTNGVWIQCFAFDGTDYGGIIQSSGGFDIVHQLQYTSPLQGVANASSGLPVNWTLNFTGTGNLTCNYTSLPYDHLGSAIVTNITSGAAVASTNSSTAVWWSCNLTSSNYSIQYSTLPPTLQYSWGQDDSQISNLSEQFLTTPVNLTNPASVNYSNVSWLVPCVNEFSCTGNSGVWANLNSSQTVTANQSNATGSAINFTIASPVQNTTYNTNLTFQEIFEAISANNSAGITFTNVYTGVQTPPGTCWYAAPTDDSPSAFLTILNGSNLYPGSIYWINNCVQYLGGEGWQQSFVNLTQQSFSYEENVTNVGGLNLSVPWSPANASSCLNISGSNNPATLVPSVPQLLAANATGSCLSATFGPLVQDDRQNTTLDGLAFVTRALNVNDLSQFNYTGVNTSLTGRPGWNCSWPQTINVTTANFSQPYLLSCNASSVIYSTRYNRVQDPAYPVSVNSTVYTYLPILVNNTDPNVSYSTVYWNESADSNWAINSNTGNISSIANGSTAWLNLSQQANASTVFDVTQNLYYNGFNWTMVENATNLDPLINYTNVSESYDINYLAVSNISYVASYNGTQYVSTTGPISYSNCTNSSDPAFTPFAVVPGSSNWSACLGYSNSSLQADAAAVIEPTLDYNSTLALWFNGLDYIPPTVTFAYPPITESQIFNATIEVDKPAMCRLSVGTDESYYNMTSDFSPSGFSSSPWYNTSLPFGNQTVYVRCSDMAGNTMNSSYVYNLTVDGCGDGVCEAWESCSTCPQDCGACTNPSSGGGGGGSSGGGGGGSGGGVGSSNSNSSEILITGLPSTINAKGGQILRFNGTLENNEFDVLYNVALGVTGLPAQDFNYTPLGFVASQSFQPFSLDILVPNETGQLDLDIVAYATLQRTGQQVESPVLVMVVNVNGGIPVVVTHSNTTAPVIKPKPPAAKLPSPITVAVIKHELAVWWVGSLVFAAIGIVILFAYGDYSSRSGMRRMYYRASWSYEILNFTGIRVTVPAVAFKPGSVLPRFYWNTLRLSVPFPSLFNAAKVQLLSAINAVDWLRDSFETIQRAGGSLTASVKDITGISIKGIKPKNNLSYRPPAWQDLRRKYGGP